MENADISPLFEYNETDSEVAIELMKLDKTPQEIIYFANNCNKLSDYAYWFLLSTSWVSYTGFSNISLWKKLFSSKRKFRSECIMKPSELNRYEKLPQEIEIYRAKRKGESDWIAYTLNFEIAKRFARERNVEIIHKYKVNKNNVLALFLRRGEEEIIVLEKSKTRLIDKIFVGV